MHFKIIINFTDLNFVHNIQRDFIFVIFMDHRFYKTTLRILSILMKDAISTKYIFLYNIRKWTQQSILQLYDTIIIHTCIYSWFWITTITTKYATIDLMNINLTRICSWTIIIIFNLINYFFIVIPQLQLINGVMLRNNILFKFISLYSDFFIVLFILFNGHLKLVHFLIYLFL